jgi:hypothetical protein
LPQFCSEFVISENGVFGVEMGQRNVVWILLVLFLGHFCKREIYSMYYVWEMAFVCCQRFTNCMKMMKVIIILNLEVRNMKILLCTMSYPYKGWGKLCYILTLWFEEDLLQRFVFCIFYLLEMFNKKLEFCLLIRSWC